MTRLLLAALAALAILAPAAAAASYTTDVPATLGAKLDRAKARSNVRVLVPSTLASPFERLYPGVRARDGHYSLDLGAVRDCRQATACFVAAFLADRGGRLSGGRRVSLARGRTGRFTPMRCGASCAAPQIEWRERGVRYTIQSKAGRGRTDRERVVRLANSAIRAGAR